MSQQEKILFQFIMNYKAYRRKMVSLRVGIAVIVAGGLCGLCAINVLLSMICVAVVLVFGVIAVLVALGNEQTYTIYNTRIVLKRRGNDSRTAVPIDSIVKVEYKRAFYEKNLATGTVTVTAVTDKGKTKKYRLRHVLGAEPAVEYLNTRIQNRGNANESGE